MTDNPNQPLQKPYSANPITDNIWRGYTVEAVQKVQKPKHQYLQVNVNPIYVNKPLDKKRDNWLSKG